MTPATAITDIVFDIGHVLLAFDPRFYYAEIPFFNGQPERLDYFLRQVCTRDWHEQHDLGRSYEETAQELAQRHPEFEAAIHAWGPNFGAMLQPIPGTIDILERLNASGRCRLTALTNFPETSFAAARAKYGFLDHFSDIVVSGTEKIKKPDAEIFRRLIQRCELAPHSALFIDDSPANCASAAKLGFRTHQFKTPTALYEELADLTLLQRPVPNFAPSPIPQPF
jgi:2-haloacid dehalogenase